MKNEIIDRLCESIDEWSGKDSFVFYIDYGNDEIVISRNDRLNEFIKRIDDLERVLSYLSMSVAGYPHINHDAVIRAQQEARRVLSSGEHLKHYKSYIKKE